MKSTPRKIGRPTAFYTMANGDKIDGLTRYADGRWKVSPFPGQPTPVKFREADERLAVAHFHAIRSGKQPEMAETVVGTFTGGAEVIRTGLAIMAKPRPTIRTVRNPDGTVTVMADEVFDKPEYWAWLRQQIVTRQKWVAERVGIEQIGYLTDIKPPDAVLTLAQAVDVYATFAKVSRDEHARIRRAWDEFGTIVGVNTVKEIDHAIAENYERALASLGLAPKSVKHRIGAVRTVLAFAMRRGKGVAHCRGALDALSMLTVEDANPLDPRPIAVRDFWAIHAAATKAGDKPFAAMLMLSLNAAMYSSEVAGLKWTDISLERGELATRRNKTGVPRVAVLWPETVSALQGLERHEHVGRLFFTAAGGVVYRQAISRKWIEFRAAAGLRNDVVYSQLRDAAFTIAARVDIDAARLLNGHKLPGTVDNYVLRRPQAVAEVCQAIREEFKVAKHAGADAGVAIELVRRIG